MSEIVLQAAWLAVPLLVGTGLYCVVVTRNLLRMLMGLELITKGITLLLVLAGHHTGHLASMQALLITLIVVEVVVIAVAAGLVINLYRHHGTLDVRSIRATDDWETP